MTRMTAERMTYELLVGDLRVCVDWVALTASISKVGENEYARTEEMGNGFLLYRNPAGEVVSVEVIAGGDRPVIS